MQGICVEYKNNFPCVEKKTHVMQSRTRFALAKSKIRVGWSSKDGLPFFWPTGSSGLACVMFVELWFARRWGKMMIDRTIKPITHTIHPKKNNTNKTRDARTRPKRMHKHKAQAARSQVSRQKSKVTTTTSSYAIVVTFGWHDDDEYGKWNSV